MRWVKRAVQNCLEQIEQLTGMNRLLAQTNDPLKMKCELQS